MISVNLENAGKRFNQRWIFRKLNFQINTGDKIAVTGNNGSGKSTLLQVVSGFVKPSEGTVLYHFDKKKIEPENIYNYISFASPYYELVDSFTLREFLHLYIKQKPLLNGLTLVELIKIIDLSKFSDQPLNTFSSGMKQKVKLGCAILADKPVLLLDEPLSNLDEYGVLLYKELINKYTTGKIVIACSNNVPDEIFFCTQSLKIDQNSVTISSR